MCNTHTLTLPALLAGGAEPGFVPLAVDPAGLADVVAAIAALALGVEKEGEGGAAADAAALVEASLPRQQEAATALLIQLLLQFTVGRRGWRRGRERGWLEAERERKRAI